jgi:ethanolamine ammonia-lyase small subunit
MLQLRADHAAARDALHEQLDLAEEPMASLVTRFGIFEVASSAGSFAEHLARPDLGRRLPAAAIERITTLCPSPVDVQFVLGDGLSSAAVRTQVPALLPLLVDTATERGLSVGQTFFVRNCRVGALNDIGAAIDAEVVVLLVGERPGLATGESLSAYLAWRPRPGDTDERRNLISNIHDGGVLPGVAATRILALVELLRLHGRSGFEIRESAALPGVAPPSA